MGKAKKKTKQPLRASAVGLDEMKENCEFVSKIESYSILEKISEWKKEEGLAPEN